MSTLAKCAPVILTLVIAVLSVWHDRNRSRARKLLYSFLYLVLALVSCWVVRSDQVTAAGTKKAVDDDVADAKKWRAEQKRNLDLVGAKLNDEGMYQNFLQDERVLLDQIIAGKSGPAQERYYSSAPDRQKVRDKIAFANAKRKRDYEIRFQPLVDLVTRTFDSWISAAKQHGSSIEREQKDIDNIPAVLDEPGGSYIRKMVFKNGTHVWLLLGPAVVKEANFEGQLYINILLVTPSGNADEQLRIDAWEKGYRVMTNHPQRFTAKNYSNGESDRPMDDALFIAATTEMLDQVLEYILQTGDPQR